MTKIKSQNGHKVHIKILFENILVIHRINRTLWAH